MPIFVKQQTDPIKNSNIGDDPLDHQKAFSETNAYSNKTFFTGNGTAWNKASDLNNQNAFVTKVYDTTGPSNVYKLGSKSTFRTEAYNGSDAATGWDKNFATKTADVGQNQVASAFAAIGSSDQNRTAPIDAKPVDTFAAPIADKTFVGPEEDARHKKLTRLRDGELLIQNLPDRPLSIDEVRELINHGIKADTTQAPPAASKPMNDPDYQPIARPPDPDTPDTPPSKVDDDDKNDPVPPPGTMADPPEPLPSK